MYAGGSHLAVSVRFGFNDTTAWLAFVINGVDRVVPFLSGAHGGDVFVEPPPPEHVGSGIVPPPPRCRITIDFGTSASIKS